MSSKGAKSPTSSVTAAAAPAPCFVHIDTRFLLLAVAYPSIASLNEGLGRLSCFGESKLYKGKYLPLAQWNAMPKSGGLVYEGHNFPATTLLQWLRLAPGDDWGPAEKVLFDGMMAKKLLSRDRKTDAWTCTFQYIIAGVSDDHETFRHELLHALYFSDVGYRELVASVFAMDLPPHLLNFAKTYMKSKGYAPEVMEDEFQAYLCGDDPSIVGGKKAADSKVVLAIKDKLRTYQRENLTWSESWCRLMFDGVLDAFVMTEESSEQKTKFTEEQKVKKKGPKR